MTFTFGLYTVIQIANQLSVDNHKNKNQALLLTHMGDLDITIAKVWWCHQLLPLHTAGA